MATLTAVSVTPNPCKIKGTLVIAATVVSGDYFVTSDSKYFTDSSGNTVTVQEAKY